LDWNTIMPNVPTLIVAGTAVVAIIYRTGKLISVLNDIKKLIERIEKLEERVDEIEKHGITISMYEDRELQQNNMFWDKMERKEEEIRRSNDERWIEVFSTLGKIEGRIKKLNGE